MPISIGTIIAGYRIEGVLGSGGMGTVYLARHPTLPRSDAMKILSAELSVDRQFRVRFTREADLAATLNHPNIVRVYNRGQTDDGHLWIAMEYVEGTAANDLDRANLTPTRIVRIITDVAAALDYAHSKRVLHRDIKPGNFLVSAPGSDHERVLLADFGIARALDDATSLTATGSMVGTAAYSAPETIEGRPADHRTDIYSLGCALFRLLTSRTPYEDNSLSAMLAGHLMRPVPHPSDINPNLPPEIDDVITRALAKDPNERFQTAGALAAATTAALTKAPAPPTTTGPRAANPSNPALTYPSTPPPAAAAPPWPAYDPRAAAGPPNSVAPQPFAGIPFSPGLPPPPDATPKAKRRKRTRIIVGATVAVVVLVAATVLGIHLFGQTSADLGPYQPQTLNTKFGALKLQHRPMAIAALGAGDPDAVLSLGAQPVLINAANATTPPWLQSLIHSTPPVFAAADAAAITAAKPDLIIDTDTIDQTTYNSLAAIAPTLTQPADNTQDWTWQTQLNWIATALGRTAAAKTLLDKAQSDQNTIRSEHRGFSGKTIVAVNYTGTTTTAAAASPSPTTSYLEGIGFTYNTHYKRSPGGPPTVPFNISDTDYIAQRSDIMLLLRTDTGAGGGGYAGLPAKYSSFGGTLVIIDDPATITALTTGGPAATTYLNTELVAKLSNQIH